MLRSVAVLVIRGHKGHRARTQAGSLTGNGDFERALPHQEHFLVDVAVRRGRGSPRIKGALVPVDVENAGGFAFPGGGGGGLVAAGEPEGLQTGRVGKEGGGPAG